MRKPVVTILVVTGLCIVLAAGVALPQGTWQGVDETVVEKFAKAAGREPMEPLINTDQGDLLLFVFLLAGVVGGFVMGYFFRHLFPPRKSDVP
jgi:ABC-type cobalt transport system substrate-binding protein